MLDVFHLPHNAKRQDLKQLFITYSHFGRQLYKVARDKFYTSPKWACCDKILNNYLVCTVYVFKCYSSAV